MAYNKYKLRHKILKLLVTESIKETKTNFTSEISLTDKEIGARLKTPQYIISGQTEVLDSLGQIQGQNRDKLNIEYCITKKGAVAYFEELHKIQGERMFFERFTRRFSYISIPLSLILSIIALLTALYSRCH